MSQSKQAFIALDNPSSHDGTLPHNVRYFAAMPCFDWNISHLSNAHLSQYSASPWPSTLSFHRKSPKCPHLVSGESLRSFIDNIWYVVPLDTVKLDLLIVLGDVMHLRVFTKHLIVLSSFEDVQELLEKRSTIYSSRPRFVLYSEM